MGYGARCLGVFVFLAAPSTARAQLAPVGVPAGAVRFELDGAFDSWDKRFDDGTKESFGAGLSGPLDSDLLSILAPSDTILQRVTGLGGSRLNLGDLGADAQADVSTAVLGLAIGVTRSIAVFGRLPLVRARVQTSPGLDAAGANAGLNPGSAAQDPFLTQFDAALSTLEARHRRRRLRRRPRPPRTRRSHPGRRQRPLRRSLHPARRSRHRGAIHPHQRERRRHRAVRPHRRAPDHPRHRPRRRRILYRARAPRRRPRARGRRGVEHQRPHGPGRDPDRRIRGELSRRRRGRRRPDDRRPVGPRAGAAAGSAPRRRDWSASPRGVRARTDRVLALGTGDGQTDVEVRGVVDLGAGNVGVRLEGGYNRQLAADVVERVAPPLQPFPARSLLANVRLDPGDVTTLAVRPFFRLARTVAIIGSVERWSKGVDAAEYRERGRRDPRGGGRRAWPRGPTPARPW